MGLQGFSQALAGEVAASGNKVTLVRPGASPPTRRAHDRHDPGSGRFSSFPELLPVGRWTSVLVREAAPVSVCLPVAERSHNRPTAFTWRRLAALGGRTASARHERQR